MSMSVREEERGKTTCPSRGLGIAAAAIGVGVGAALYYFFSKRPENPNSQGSTSDWNCEQQQAFSTPDTDDSYTTISENETSDTSVHNSLSEFHLSTSEYSIVIETSSEAEESSDDDSSSSEESDDTEMVDSDLPNDFEYRWVSLHDAITTIISAESEGHGVMGNGQSVETASSLGMPRDGAFSSMASFMGRVANLVSVNKKKKTENEQMNILRQQAFRQRSWTLEECSICFEVMLRDQEVMSLPCSHNFHSECILPWLQEKQTCPNCRKVAE